jgi:ABC-2 type transport system ATP-binding protein
MAMLDVQNVSKTYDDLAAVNDISFTVQEGEIFGFLGPNGAGKTTTINMLTGLANPTGGAIAYQGQDVTRNIKAAQHLIGIVPDDSNLYDELSGFDNLCFCAALYGMRKPEREVRARQLLEQFGLKEAGKKLFKAYSKGMKRKLTIAAGIIHQPPMLFLDEPTTGIDVASARQIRSLLKTLNQGGVTIFLTTHYIEEAERLCDRIAFIVQGRIVRTGTVAELMSSVQQHHLLQVAFEGARDPQQLAQAMNAAFPDCSIRISGSSTLQIQSPTPLALMPFMRFFEERGVKIFEAKIMKPSLEEVFVQITGIETAQLQKDKEGGKKR